MNRADMHNETRVQVARDFEIWPRGRVAAGLVGIVKLTGGDGLKRPYALVHFETGDPLPVWADVVPIVTAADFEPVAVDA